MWWYLIYSLIRSQVIGTTPRLASLSLSLTMSSALCLCVTVFLLLSIPSLADNSNVTEEHQVTAEHKLTISNSTKQEDVLPALENVVPLVAAKIMEGVAEVQTLLTAPDSLKKNLGSKCNITTDCAPMNNTYCSDGVCVCLIGFIPSKHRLDACLRVPSGIGDFCEEATQCEKAVAGSECREAMCQCPLNYIISDGRCWQKKDLGSICNVTAQCESIESAVCAQNVCTCEAPRISGPNNKCLQPAGNIYAAPCVEDIQCTYSYGDHAHCLLGECRCTNNYHYDGSQCIPDKKLGDTCSGNKDCDVSELTNVANSRVCINSTCECADGFKMLFGEEVCTKSSGEELAVSLTWVLCIVLAKYYLA